MSARANGGRPARSGRPALANWLTVRITALLLTVLVLGHFVLTHFVTDVADTDSSFVAARWASPLFIAWDWTMLAAAVVHGAAGLWIAIGEYAAGRRRSLLRQGLIVLSLLMIVGGTLTIIRAAGL